MDTERSGDNQPQRRRKRPVRPLIVLLAAVLLVGSAGFLWMRKMQERKEFVSDVEPATGYRCRFTIGVGWKHNREDRRFVGSWDVGMPPDRFSSTPSNPLLQWITGHLLHRPQAEADPAEISLFVEAIGSPAEASFLNGYPDRPEVTPPLSKRHLIIDGCRAILETHPYSGTSTAHETDLVICTPDRKVFFEVISYSSMQGDPADRELEQIIRSFHIEKVSKPIRKP